MSLSLIAMLLGLFLMGLALGILAWIDQKDIEALNERIKALEETLDSHGIYR